MERCSKCVIPDTFPGIRINPEGVCSFCTQAPENEVPRCPGNPDQLLALVAKHRLADSPYDCAVKLSGGRDSTYVLYYAVRILGLRVLALTVDHGLLPEHTRENIRKAVSILNVGHVVMRNTAMEGITRAMLSAWLQRPSAATVALLCLGCHRAMHVALADAARRNGSPLILNGVGEAGVHDYLATRFFAPGEAGWKAHLKIATGFGREFLRNPRFLASPHIVRMMIGEYVAVMSDRWRNRKSAGLKEISLFGYVPWDEDTIVQTIQRELDWRPWPAVEATWRSDCKLAVLKTQFYLFTTGFSLQDAMIAGLVRTGRISRAAGIQRLARENLLNPQLVEEVLQDIGVPIPSAFRKFLIDRSAA